MEGVSMGKIKKQNLNNLIIAEKKRDNLQN
jgi:hypothetical protein